MIYLWLIALAAIVSVCAIALLYSGSLKRIRNHQEGEKTKGLEFHQLIQLEQRKLFLQIPIAELPAILILIFSYIMIAEQSFSFNDVIGPIVIVLLSLIGGAAAIYVSTKRTLADGTVDENQVGAVRSLGFIFTSLAIAVPIVALVFLFLAMN